MFRIKKNDIVMVTSGKDKGKTGKVVRINREASLALVEGVNLAKKHVRRTKENQQGGIIHTERPVSLSSIMLLCKNCNRPVRIGYQAAKDNTKTRFCRKCKQTI